MKKTKQKSRVLAYTLAKEIDLERLESITGGQGSDSSHMSQRLTNYALSSLDYVADF